jgi:hypothetical protein
VIFGTVLVWLHNFPLPQTWLPLGWDGTLDAFLPHSLFSTHISLWTAALPVILYYFLYYLSLEPFAAVKKRGTAV